ncbi:hypothetical protein F4779DRAFT_610489 [Xylariaceae sp. FL0662B]|nr:hypothetical protein F4779DRAFT_610489 [Xylariaceae sp. FL0662B]
MQLFTPLILAFGAGNAYSNVVQPTSTDFAALDNTGNAEKRQPAQHPWNFNPNQARCVICIAGCRAQLTERERNDEVHAPMHIGRCYDWCIQQRYCANWSKDEYLRMFRWEWAPPQAYQAAWEAVGIF